MAELKITLKRSIIGRPQNQRDTVKALGLTKLNSTVVKPANDVLVAELHLVTVKQLDADKKVKKLVQVAEYV